MSKTHLELQNIFIMNRRKALKNVAFLLGGAISASTMGILFESFTLPEHEKNFVSFSADEEKLLAEFANIIIPDTAAAPGAKAAGLGQFIPMMVRDCYPAKQQTSFANGLKAFDEKCLKDFGKNFVSLSVDERQQLLTAVRTITIEQRTNKSEADKDLAYFFIVGRDLTLLGYFSSEIGCTQAREYVPIPGKYDGNTLLKPDQRSWAT